MRKEKWMFKGKEIEIPIVEEGDIERNNIEDLEETKEFPIISDYNIENTQTMPNLKEEHKDE